MSFVEGYLIHCTFLGGSLIGGTVEPIYNGNHWGRPFWLLYTEVAVVGGFCFNLELASLPRYRQVGCCSQMAVN